MLQQIENALYSCLVFLVKSKANFTIFSKEELLNRLDELSKLPDGWDGEGSLALSRNIVDFVKRSILLAADTSLQNWVAFRCTICIYLRLHGKTII